MQKIDHKKFLLITWMLLSGNVLADPSAAPCDLYANGINFGSYRADNTVPVSITGRLGVACRNTSTYYCIGFDAGMTFKIGVSGDYTPFIPKDGATTFDASKRIEYHLYQSDISKLPTNKKWGNNTSKFNPQADGGIFCFPGASCTETSPCEFPVSASTDSPQSETTSKNAGGYSYTSGGNHPSFILYQCTGSGSGLDSCATLTGTNIHEQLMANAYVSSGCAVSASPFHFGTVNDAMIGSSGPCIKKPNLIQVNCSGISSYDVYLNYGAIDATTKLGCPAQSRCLGNYTNVPWSYLQYNLYLDDTCNNVWGDQTFGSVKTCAVTSGMSGACDNNSYSVSGKILSKSSTSIASGFYEDVVNVVVNYRN